MPEEFHQFVEFSVGLSHPETRLSGLSVRELRLNFLPGLYGARGSVVD
jgi:hypothetical protein